MKRVSQRAYSIRTRIKTEDLGKAGLNHWDVREHIPLEQGLRLSLATSTTVAISVREHIPLEQGLRHELSTEKDVSDFVREHIPLEQGLRLTAFLVCCLKYSCQRAYSIRTRIKTFVGTGRYLVHYRQRAYSIRTRIKTYLISFIRNGLTCQRAYSIRTRIKT